MLNETFSVIFKHREKGLTFDYVFLLRRKGKNAELFALRKLSLLGVLQFLPFLSTELIPAEPEIISSGVAIFFLTF